jgi:AcrR family transcriptional regulator
LTLTEATRRDEIIAALVRTVVDEGIDGLTVKKVAERAGVSPALVMYYFTNKDEMIIAAWTAAVDRLTSRIHEGAADPEGAQKLHDMFRVNFVDRDPGAPPWGFWLNLWAKASGTPELRARHEAGSEQRRQGFIAIVETAIERGEMRPDIDATLMGDLVYALLYGLAVKVTLDGAQVSEQRALQIFDLLLSLAQPPR